MFLRKLLSKVKLHYEDPAEEQEFLSIKMPLLKDFLTYLLICMIALLIPLSIHFFAVLQLYAQGYMSVSMLLLAVLLFLGRNKFGKWMEHIVLAYLLAIVTLVIFNLGQVLLSLKSCESFYGGYAFALLHRTLGYRVVKFHSMLLFHLSSLILRLIVLYDHNLSVTLMVSAVEVCTMCLSIKSEKGERDLFDSLYKSKQQLIKFKDFLTDHLPHQMAIFAKDYSGAFLMNKAFRLCFQCDDIYQTKCSLKALIIEKEAINKNMTLFARLGYIPDTQTQPLSLSQFMWLLSKNLDVIRGTDVFSFQVYEDENILMNPCTISHESGQNSSDEDIVTPKVRKERSKSKSQKPRVPKRGSMVFSEGPGSPMEKLGAFTERLVKKTPFEEGVGHEAGEEESVEEKAVVNEDGKGRIFKVKIFMLQWDGEEAIGVMLDDISQQRTFMELKMANKNKDMVVAMVSHEIRTPLNGMMGLIDIAKKNVNDENVVPYLDACRNSGVFLLNLVNSMLDLSQIKVKKLRLAYSKVNIKEMLNEVKTLFEPFANTKKIFLKLDISPNVPEIIKTDRARLMQILINIIGNAFKFTSEGGITIKVELERQVAVKVKFTVVDTGLGIKKEDLGRLFKLFGRLENQNQKVNSNGVGLGLTISNTLAMLLNPYENRGIHVESEPGKGSNFSFYVQSRNKDTLMARLSNDASIRDIIPAFSDDDDDGEPGLGVKAAPYTLSKTFIKTKSDQNGYITPQAYTGLKRNEGEFRSFTSTLKTKESGIGMRDDNSPWCLIVDDNPFNLMVGRYIMEEKGYWIKTVLNGKEAIEEIKEHEKKGKVFKVVLMDCEMPIMDGYGVTKALRKLMKTGEIKECPIVALSANKGDMEQERKCKDAGMVGCISKPLQTKELDEVLDKIKK